MSAPTADGTSPADDEVIIEGATPLSQSMLWDVQRTFYEAKGMDAWVVDGVPHYVTTNPSIARSYAQTVFGFFRDVWSTPKQSKQSTAAAAPVVVELGAGSGQFAFHFLRAMEALLQGSPYADRSFTYVMTDFAQANVDAWCAHPSLARFVSDGRLDFAVFDASECGPITLLNGGQTLGTPGDEGRPVVLIANYVFDSLPQDLLRVSEEGLVEHRVEVTAAQPEPDLGAPGALERLSMAWPVAPFDSDRYADEPVLAGVLAWYSDRLYNASFLLPVAALRCLEHFRTLSSGAFLAIVGDRGYDRLSDLVENQGPQLGLHGGCFSLPMNFHAVGVWAGAHDGVAMTTRRGHSSLNVNAFAFGVGKRPLLETQAAFTAAIGESGPDDFYAMQQVAARFFGDMSLPEVLAVIRWSAYDPVVFSAALPALIVLVEGAPEHEFHDVRSVLANVWASHFPVQGGPDLAFSIATVLYGMGRYLDALEFLHHSLDLVGPDPATYFNIGMAHHHLGQNEPALEMVRRSIELSPDFQQARSMEAMIAAELAPS